MQREFNSRNCKLSKNEASRVACESYTDATLSRLVADRARKSGVLRDLPSCLRRCGENCSSRQGAWHLPVQIDSILPAFEIVSEKKTGLCAVGLMTVQPRKPRTWTSISKNVNSMGRGRTSLQNSLFCQTAEVHFAACTFHPSSEWTRAQKIVLHNEPD